MCRSKIRLIQTGYDLTNIRPTNCYNDARRPMPNCRNWIYCFNSCKNKSYFYAIDLFYIVVPYFSCSICFTSIRVSLIMWATCVDMLTYSYIHIMVITVKYNVSLKRPTIFLAHDFAKCWPILKILSTSDSA